MPEVPPQFSSYYRPGQPIGHPPSPGVVSFDAISIAWNIMSNDWGLFVPAAALSVVAMYAAQIPLSFVQQALLSGAMQNHKDPFTDLNGGFFFGYLGVGFFEVLVGQCVQIIFQLGLMEMFLKKLQGRPASFGDLFTGFSHFLPLVVAILLSVAAQMIGFALCVLPGLYAYGVLAFVPLLVVHQGLRGTSALKASFEILKPQGIMMAALMLVGSILSGVGGCACGIGLCFTFPIHAGIVAVTYYNFFPPAELMEQPLQTVPPPFSV